MFSCRIAATDCGEKPGGFLALEAELKQKGKV